MIVNNYIPSIAWFLPKRKFHDPRVASAFVTAGYPHQGGGSHNEFIVEGTLGVKAQPGGFSVNDRYRHDVIKGQKGWDRGYK